MLFGMNVKDLVIGGVAVTSLAGSTVNFISNRKLKKRMNATEEVLQRFAAMPAPAPAAAPAQPVQPQAPTAGEESK